MTDYLDSSTVSGTTTPSGVDVYAAVGAAIISTTTTLITTYEHQSIFFVEEDFSIDSTYTTIDQGDIITFTVNVSPTVITDTVGSITTVYSTITYTISVVTTDYDSNTWTTFYSYDSSAATTVGTIAENDDDNGLLL